MRFTPRTKRTATLLLSLVIVLLLLAPASTSARGAASQVDWVFANGSVDPSAGFTSFHLFAASVNHGPAVGFAVFNDVPEAGGRLVVKVTCLNVMTSLISMGARIGELSCPGLSFSPRTALDSGGRPRSASSMECNRRLLLSPMRLMLSSRSTCRPSSRAKTQDS
jgi:hypothetical protein